MPRDRGPEPNFKALVTHEHIPRIVVTGHALQCFVQRLEPSLPGADHVAKPMPRLEDLGSGHRSRPEQGQLNRYREWMAEHVQPHLLQSIRCEGFRATERPRWYRSSTPADGWLQVGGLCLFPIAIDDERVFLTTCECGTANDSDVTWDIALTRHMLHDWLAEQAQI